MTGGFVERHIKWFDLARFGAALRVVPESPLRGVAVTCLEIRDRDLYQRMYGWPTDREVTADERRALHESFTQAKQDLGFGEQPQPVSVGSYENNDFKQYLRFFSTKTEFSLSELRRLCPGLDAEDLRDMPVDEIRLVAEPEAGMDGEWAAFADRVLAAENKGVWTPVANPFEKPFADSGAIPEADPRLSRQEFPLLGGNTVSRHYGMSDRLHRANYRQNALVPFYADLESAQADGWKREDLQQVDLPYAAPLWVTRAGQIIALKDVRFAPEIMDIGPEQYYSAGPGGLIVSAIREAKGIAPVVAKAVENWREWGASPEKLEMPDLLWGSITGVVSAVEELRQRHPRLPSDVKHLTDGNEAERGGSVRAKPLTDITEGDVRLLALTASRFVPMADAEQVELAGLLGAALKRGHELMADHAKELAKQKLRELAETVQTDAAAPGDGKVKHVDAGEKIGGARKDYARRSLTIEDLDSMNDMERKTYVLKKNVWASLNYQQMREDGVTPQAAIAIKYLKDAINVEPDRRHSMIADDPEGEYIRAVGAVRDAMAEVKTLDDFKGACIRLFKAGRGDSNYIYGGSAFQVAIGSDASHLLYDSERSYGWGENVNTEAVVPQKIRSEISKRERRVAGWGQTATEEQLWGTLIKAKRVKSEAEKEAEAEKADQDRELHRPHLDRVERSGEDWRSGRDIVADDLIEHFGFRAVEFGNWLPQDERQQVLNMAFDSLCDLADALDIPPSGVSFDGELAVAFGSRGRGGKHAALAHFEPARFVINLTRMKGAGSLAHEWMHALDFHLGEKAGYASEQREGDPRGSVMGALSHAMKRRPGDAEDIHSRASANARRGADNALSWLYLQSEETRRHLKDVMESLHQKAATDFTEKAARHIEAIKGNPSFSETGIGPAGAVVWEALSGMEEEIFETLRKGCDNKPGFTKVKDKVEGNIAYMVRNLALACTVEAARELQVDLPLSFRSGANGRDTAFHEQAKQLDKTRSAPYWATTRELFARAGAAYVLDQLDAKGARSDYLVYGADEQRYASHPVGNPNPTGSDRRVLAEHFNNLMAEYRLRCVSRAEADTGVEP